MAARRQNGRGSSAAATAPQSAITMAAVGRIAGVSQVTVSRALNHPNKVSPEALSRIQEAIRVTGYVPNLTAASLASRRTRLIAAVVPSITNIIYSTLVQRFAEAIHDNGYQVLLSETGFSQDEEYRLVAALLSRRPDGILLTGVHHSAECRRLLLSANIPTVEVWDISETPIDICVGFSHTEAPRAVAEFVHRKGYRKAAAVAADDERAIRRMQAFCEALSRLGFEDVPTIELEGRATFPAGRASLAELLDRGFHGGAIFCSSDVLAHGILTEAVARGLRVPQDIAVIGFGDQDFAAQTYPPLTTVRIDRVALGHKAADLMLRRLKGETIEQRRCDIGFNIVERASA
jgi:LacI family transcriptional regulator, gluconate utilization system Gnt-I transcriptional repressor